MGSDRAPSGLALVTGVGSLAALLGNPCFGELCNRTSGSWGMRRPWMIIGLLGESLGVAVVPAAPSLPVVLVGWCVAQLFLSALLAALVAVLPDQVPVSQRGLAAYRSWTTARPDDRSPGTDMRSSSSPRRTADRRLLTPSLA